MSRSSQRNTDFRLRNTWYLYSIPKFDLYSQFLYEWNLKWSDLHILNLTNPGSNYLDKSHSVISKQGWFEIQLIKCFNCSLF